MKTVKRLCSLLFVLTLLGALTVPAYADVIGVGERLEKTFVPITAIAVVVFVTVALIMTLRNKKK